jgi:signal transduction histidine kinase
MSLRNFVRLLGGPQGLNMALIITASATLLITVNWFTLKTTSAIRAYINGESQYSKGEKDATLSLVDYVYSKDENDYVKFKTSLLIPEGDRKARIGLEAHRPAGEIKKYFLAGNNNSGNIDDMIWLYQNFRNISFMRHCIKIWTLGDSLVAEKGRLGLEAHQKISTHIFTSDDEANLIQRINNNNDQLLILEREFSDVLDKIARKIDLYLRYFNTVLILSLFLAIQMFVSFILTKLRQKNRELKVLNEELDLLVYSVTHDLKSPMASVQGLINLSLNEEDSNQVDEYLTKMTFTLEKQNRLIQNIIQTKRNQLKTVQLQEVSLTKLVEQSIQQHIYMEEAKGISFSQEIEVDRINTDELLLEAIVNNLISNSIKHHDITKTKRYVAIHVKSLQDNLVIKITDNGKGIDDEERKLIFEKFYTSAQNAKSFGLGLSIVKENVNKLRGAIAVDSKKGVGTTFTINIPLKNR